ncbi:hypothetical protein TNCV_783531 [Trichonephila clavipes]|nr:hypothetical protein TNCV_783531 [Trichonephila clavipes]
MSRFGGLSEERPSAFKTPSKLGTHLSTQCSGDERRSYQDWWGDIMVWGVLMGNSVILSCGRTNHESGRLSEHIAN